MAKKEVISDALTWGTRRLCVDPSHKPVFDHNRWFVVYEIWDRQIAKPNYLFWAWLATRYIMLVSIMIGSWHYLWGAQRACPATALASVSRGTHYFTQFHTIPHYLTLFHRYHTISHDFIIFRTTSHYFTWVWIFVYDFVLFHMIPNYFALIRMHLTLTSAVITHY